MSFSWDNLANTAISEIARNNQALAGQIRSSVQKYAEDNARTWKPDTKYSKSFRAAAIEYRAEYKLEKRTDGRSVVHITRVEMA